MEVRVFSPTPRKLARDTGQHNGRVSEAINWLKEDGWLTLDRRIAHGGREFTLTIPQRSGESNAGAIPEKATEAERRSGESNAERSSVRSAFRREQRTS